MRRAPHRHDELHEELDAWRANVGSPIAIDAGHVAPPRLAGIDVLCWNVAIGLGRLPGDIVIERENFRLYIPLATCLVLSLVISILLNIFWR